LNNKKRCININVINVKEYKYILYIIVVFLLIVLIINNSTTIIKRIYPLKYQELVFSYSEFNGIDPYLVFAVIKAESSFNPYAKSKKDAMGLMQITENTAKWGAESMDIKSFKIEDLYDPETNIRIGCWYIKQLMVEFKNDIDLVLAAYNGGSGNVNEWLRNNTYSKTGKKLDVIPFRETDTFIKRVRNYQQIYIRLYSER